MNKEVVWHFVFWFLLFLVFAMSYGGDEAYYMRYLQNNVFMKFPFYLTAAYSFNYWLVPMYLNRERKVGFVLNFLFTSYLLFITFRFVNYWLTGYDPRIFNISSYLVKILSLYAPALIMYAYQVQVKQQEERNRLIVIQKEKLNTELKYLKAQLNPHFLFNTLNNLYSFIVTHSPKAPEIVLRLSEMLDYILYKSETDFVPVYEEVKVIENYIFLEKVRYGERLSVSFENAKNVKECKIAPLIFLSIVENAFKHGVSGNIDISEVKIELELVENILVFEVFNSKPKQFNMAKTDAYKKGIGLENMKKQLNLIYKESHTLEIKDKPDSFSLKLSIML